MRHTGPVAWKLGDQALAVHKPYARKLLGQLDLRRRLGDTRNAWVHHNLPDGTRIEASILGEIYVAKIYSVPPVEDEVSEACYMDSGYLVAGDYSNVIDPSGSFTIQPSELYQTTRLQDLYQVADDIGGIQPLAEDVVGGGGFPPSFEINEEGDVGYEKQRRLLWDKTRTHLYPTALAGNNTGKFKLRAQAQLGRKLEQYPESIPIINSFAASLSTYGLFTDEDGEYWQVYINGGTTAQFRLLDVPESARERMEEAQGADEFLVAETHALACATTSDVVHTVDIANHVDYLKGSPLRGSWAFNWDGNQAVLVAHEGVGMLAGTTSTDTVKISVISRVLTIKIAHSYDARRDQHNFTARMSSTAEKRWTYHNFFDFFWQSFMGEANQLQWCPVRPPGSIEDLKWDIEPRGVPIDAYFGSTIMADAGSGGHKTNELQVVTHTRYTSTPERDIGNNCAGNNHYIWCSDSWVMLDKWDEQGNLQHWSVSVGPYLIAEVQGRDGAKWASKTVDFSFQLTSSEDFVSSGLTSTVYSTYTCTPSSGCVIESETYTCYEHFVRCPTNSLAVTNRVNKGKRRYKTLTGNYIFGALGTAIVFPIDCREGVTVVDVEAREYTSATFLAWETTTAGENAYGEYVNATCHCDGQEYPVTSGFEGVTYPIPGGSTKPPVGLATDVWEAMGSAHFVGRNPSDVYSQSFDVVSVSGDVTGGIPFYGFFFPNNNDPCIDDFVQMQEGVQDARIVTGYTVNEVLNGMPEALLDPHETGIIGFG